MVTTPFLKLPVDQSLWVQKEEGWWALNSAHNLLEESRPYNGVLHAEILPRETTTVFNLGVETFDGAQVFSFSFPKNQDGIKTFKDSGLSEYDEKKALKIACELLHHLLDEPLRRDLLERINSRVSQLELTTTQSVWDRF